MSLEGKSHLSFFSFLFTSSLCTFRVLYSTDRYGHMDGRALGQAVVAGDNYRDRAIEIEHRLFGTRPSSARVPLDIELPDRFRAMTFFYFSSVFWGCYSQYSTLPCAALRCFTVLHSAALCPIRPMHMFLHFLSFK